MVYHKLCTHLHCSHEPNASIASHMARAAALGISHIYTTEHDTRMGPKRHDMTSFSLTAPALTVKRGHDGEAGFIAEEGATGRYDFSPAEGGYALTITAEAGERAALTFFASGKPHCRPLFARVTLAIALAATVSAGGYAAVEVILSSQPPSHRQARLCYYLGTRPTAAQLLHPRAGENPEMYPDTDGGPVQFLPMPAPVDGVVTLPISRDASEEVGGLDNAFCSLRLVAEGGAVLTFTSFHVEDELAFEDCRQEMRQVAERLGARYGVTPFVSYEISGAGNHKNVFSTHVPVIDYAARGYTVTNEEAIAHVREHGGIFSWNHPLTRYARGGGTPDERTEQATRELIESRAFGATTIEVGFPKGRNGFEARHYLTLYDRLCAAGIAVSAIGSSDSHFDLPDRWEYGNNFCTFVGLYEDETPSEAAFIHAMRRGSLFAGNPVLLRTLTLSAGHRPQGSILCEWRTEVTLEAEAACRGEVILIADGGELGRYPVEADTPFTVTVPYQRTSPTSYVRAELWREDGLLLGLSNPIYLWDEEAVAREPEAARLRSGAKGRRLALTRFLAEHTGTRVLHIGDTPTESYEDVMALVSLVRPDVIIHTGDLADECKAGRIDAHRAPWRESAARLLSLLSTACERLIVVAGNNDIAEEIPAMAEGVELLPRNATVMLDGHRYLLCHEVALLDKTAPADLMLYGHGLTGEDCTPSQNRRGTALCFNASWGPSVHIGDAHHLV